MAESKVFSVLAGAAITVAFLVAPVAHAAPFTLGAFETYGLLVNDGASGGDINTPPVDANIGVGNVTGAIDLHNEVVNGKVDCESSCSTALKNSAITGTWPLSLGGGPTSPPPVTSNVAAVETAITAAKNLSSTYAAEAGSGTNLGAINNTITINASNGFLDATGARVFTASTFSPGNSHTVTINGAASDYVVLDVTGGSGNSLNGALTLTGGITPDHVLINFTGSGANVQGAANGATLEGTFLIPDLGVQLNSLTIDGHLFGGAAGDNFQFVSNAFINQPAVPVPLIGHGLIILLAVGGVLFGGRTLERIRNRRSPGTAGPHAAAWLFIRRPTPEI